MVSMIWNRADSPIPAETLNPLDYGWTRVDDIWVPFWYEGEALPDSLMEADNKNPGSIDDEVEDNEGQLKGSNQ